MSDFRYNENAQALEDNLEEVLESHKVEQEKAAAAEAAAEAEKFASELPALSRIAAGQTASGQVQRIIEERRGLSKSAAELITEHRLREDMRKISGRGRSIVNDFLAEAKS